MSRLKLGWTGMLVLFGCMGCSAGAEETTEYDTESGPNDSPLAPEMSSPDMTLKTVRPDVVGGVGFQGHWGTWFDYWLCPYPQFIVGAGTYSQPFQGAGEGANDDVAMFGAKAFCKSRYDGGPGAQFSIDYPELNWQIGADQPGHFLFTATCPGNGSGGVPTNPIKGVRMRWEGPQGGGNDDTAMNAADYMCSSGSTVYPGAHTSWGSWSQWGSCPAGTAACGMGMQIEGPQGGGDDTGANGIRLWCCPWQGCTAQETQACAAFGCGCNNHTCSGGACECTSQEKANCAAFGCFCNQHQCTDGACG